MSDKPDIIEFIEAQCGVKLLEYQKVMLRKMYEAGPDTKIIFPRWNGRTEYRLLATMVNELFKESNNARTD